MKKEKNAKTAAKPAPSLKKDREMPFYVVKRGDAAKTPGRSILIHGGAILIALLLCGIATIFVTGDNPISIYATMFKGAFGDAHNLWKTLQDIAILLCVSLAVTPAFKMRFWNTGAEGQVLISALATAMCMFYLGGAVPTPVLMLIMILCSILAGVIWAVVPAVFKAFWGTNETLFTLMMNYVAIQLVEVFLKVADKSGSNTVGPNLLKHGWFPELFGQKYLLNILIVAVLTVLVYIYLKYSKQGYEISVVGESENTARYIGVNVKKVIIRTMVVSGALCGVAGLLLVAGTSHSIDSNLVGGRGFTAIMVSWLAKFDPLMMVLTTLLLVFLDRGASEVTTNFGLNSAYSEILTGVIIFFIIGCEFFINYKVMINRNHPFFKKKEQEAAKEVL
ncbi:MAG: ABC transporter permease [Clostridia bacterium]|nr:ABC transporter permease [Clostridia bacterium]